MAKTRRFSSYRRLDKPYTRTSKYRAKSYIRMTKNPRIVRWHMGDRKGDYEYVYYIKSKQALQIRDLALESMRVVSNRILEKFLGKDTYYLHLRIYPHHIIREHALASGAGADRMSSGMARPFGKPSCVAAQIKQGQILMEVFCNHDQLEIVKKALSRAKTKLPGSYTLELNKIEKPVEAEVKPTDVKKPVKAEEKPVEVTEEVKTEAKPTEVKEPLKSEEKPAEATEEVKTEDSQ